jgi:hypothetical protein
MCKTITIYAVECGSYSDYHIIGLFSSESNAQLVIKAISEKVSPDWEPEPIIVEYILDPSIKELSKGYLKYEVIMLKDGSVESCKQINMGIYHIVEESYIQKRSQIPYYSQQGLDDCLNATVLAKDHKHAIKIVNEYRTQLIATNKWEDTGA